MAIFSYIAQDAAGCQTTGTLAADSPAEGRQQLRDGGLRIIDFEPARASPSRRTWMATARRREQVADAARNISLLLRAGVPLTEALEVLGRQLTGPLAAVLEDVRDRVTGGAALGDALAVHDDWFDPLFISAARVGELSGHLDDALGQLAEHLRASETLRNKVTTALTYPLILVVIGTGVVLFLMQFVVPQLLTVLIDSGRPLPASTRLLKGVSDGLINHWLILAVSAVLLGAGAKAMLRHPVVRRFWHRTQLRLPIVGRLIRANLVAGFAQRMSLLLSTGIPFVEAARHVAALSRQTVLADELTALAIAVESGSDIAPALGQSRVFPPVVLRLLAVGQDSGELPFMLKQLKERYEAEVQLALARFTAALEPVLIVALASIVGFVVFACLMPILEVTRGITVS